MDARDFNLYRHKLLPVIRPASPFSPIRFFLLLAAIPVLAWHWSGQALHLLELQWVRAHPQDVQSLTDACRAASSELCDVQAIASLLNHLSLTLVLLVPKIMALAASMPSWPQGFQRMLLRHAQWIGVCGLILTLGITIARGVVGTLLVWLVPVVWWNDNTLALQAACVVGLIAVLRLPPHLLLAWRLAFAFTRRRTGRAVGNEECPGLWSLVDAAANRLGVDKPTHLVLGVFPDCRLECGKMTLDPNGEVIEGRILYLGVTLTSTLSIAQLQSIVEQALLRSRGKFGSWLPMAEDWAESSSAYLKDCKDRRASRALGNAADPSIGCWDGWLTTVGKLLANFKEEHGYWQKKDVLQTIDDAAAGAQAMLTTAQLAYKKDVFHLFIVDLSSGIACPPVLRRFTDAFVLRHTGIRPVVQIDFTGQDLNDELVLLEKEWLIKTGQATTPTDCWELRVA